MKPSVLWKDKECFFISGLGSRHFVPITPQRTYTRAKIAEETGENGNEAIRLPDICPTNSSSSNKMLSATGFVVIFAFCPEATTLNISTPCINAVSSSTFQRRFTPHQTHGNPRQSAFELHVFGSLPPVLT